MKIDKELIQFITLFEKITKTQVEDCFIYNEDRLVFIVKEGQVKTAIGDKGKNVIKLAEMTKKKIKVVENSKDVINFIKSFISPIKSKDVILEDDIVTVYVEGTREKGLLIGRNGKNLRGMEEVVRKYFPDIKEIKIS